MDHELRCDSATLIYPATYQDPNVINQGAKSFRQHINILLFSHSTIYIRLYTDPYRTMPLPIRETVTRLAAISKLLVLSYIIDWIFIMYAHPPIVLNPIDQIHAIQRHRLDRIWLLQTGTKPASLQFNRSNN